MLSIPSSRRPFGVEQEYFVQLFVEQDKSLQLPTVGELLTKMFIEQKIRFTKVQLYVLYSIVTMHNAHLYQ